MTDWHLRRAVVCLHRIDESQEQVVKRKRINNDDCDGKGKTKKRKMDEERVEFENVEEENLDPSLERFLQIMNHVFERTADLDLSEIMDNEDEDLSAVSSSDPVLDESLLGPIVLASDKLRSFGLTNKISCRKLVRLLKILHLCVTVPAPIVDSEGIESLSDIDDDSIRQLIASLNASLAILNIMTSSGMPKVVYMEELVLRIVKTAKLYLQNFLYAQFDPRYRMDKEFVKGHSVSAAKRNDRAATRDARALQMYTLLTRILALLFHLVEMQELTDVFVLEASSLAISPFLVENVHELQLVSLKLTYKIFSRYEKHQQLILEDILLLLAKLPCTTKNIRSYRNSHSEQIQRLTMLILHLFQSVVKCTKDVFRSKKIQADDSVTTELLSSYSKSLKTAQVFLSLFLSKCSARSEEDYRPLFENFVMDLLDIVHLPEWPSVEPILIILSSLLVKQFRTKSADMPSRVAALGYLGLIAARLRKEDAGCRENSEVEEVLTQHGFQHLNEAQKAAHLQNLLLDYLSIKSEDESSSYFCRLFYIAQWCSDHAKSASSSPVAGEMNGLSKETVSRARTARCSSSSNGPVRNESASQAVNGLSKETISKVQTVLQALLTKKCPESGTVLMSSSGARAVARYLASRRSFVQKSDSRVLHSCADVSLMHILLIVGETTSALRSKAMKCLAGVIDADPQVLLMREVQDAIHCRCLDQSVSVRDAAVDLLGKSILQNEDLVDNYYGMLSERILDTGISVRKRVIAIFRDICLKFPMHSRVPDMCGQMLKRIGDEEGIKKLVTETFEGMWFTPLDETNIVAIRQRVDNIVGIVAACKQSFISDWMEQLVFNLLKKEKDKHHAMILSTCKIIVNGLVQVLPDLVEEFKDGSVPDCSRLVAAFTSLYIFCKLKPEFLVPHCSSLHIFLDPEYLSQMDSIVRHHAVHIFEMILPYLTNPDQQLMMQIENLLKKLILNLGTLIVQRSFSCLAVLVKNVTHNYSTVEFCFHNFFRVLLHYRIEHAKNPSSPILKTNMPLLLRSLFIVGLLCEHFDCDEFGDHTADDLLDRIFQTLFYFTNHESEDARMKALDAIGHMAVAHSDLMLQSHLRDLYTRHLSYSSLSVKLCCQVLKNIRTYLIEEEARMMAADHRWKELQNQESLKEMADVQSGMAGTIIQVYLKMTLELSFYPDVDVRLSALNLIATVLHQGLVPPAQCVPYLICLGSDHNSSINKKANHWLKEIHKKDQRFIQAKEALQGVRMSYQLQLKLQDFHVARAHDTNSSAKPSSVNGFLYSLLRTNRGYRRVFLRSLLRLFDDSQDTDLKELIFASDCIAGFGFQQQDEVLYLIHQLDSIVSNSGSNVLRLFTKVLYPDKEEQKKRDDEDDDDEDLDSVLQIMPEDGTRFKRLCVKSQRFHLLLLLRRFLMSHYGISDRIIQQYSPTDGAKMHDKPLNVKNSSKFNSGSNVINALLQQDISRRELAKVYLSFKDLMIAICDVAEDESLNQAQTGKAVTGLGSNGSS